MNSIKETTKLEEQNTSLQAKYMKEMFNRLEKEKSEVKNELLEEKEKSKDLEQQVSILQKENGE